MHHGFLRKDGLSQGAQQNPPGWQPASVSEQGRYLFLSLRQDIYIELVAHD